MYNKIKNIISITSFLIFVLFVSKYYFSEQNVIFINKSRISYKILSINETINLPKLESDTKNVIVYINDLENFKNKKKERVWEKLIYNEN